MLKIVGEEVEEKYYSSVLMDIQGPSQPSLLYFNPEIDQLALRSRFLHAF